MSNLVWNNRGDLVDSKTGTVHHKAHPQCRRDNRCLQDQRAGKHKWYFKTLGR